MFTSSERFKVIEIICCYNPTKTSGELEIDEIIRVVYIPIYGPQCLWVHMTLPHGITIGIKDFNKD